MQDHKLIRIFDGDSICTICPALGGSIIGWSAGDQQMLRRADAAAIASADPLSLASFPLVPYSNRIGYARFNWGGLAYEITPNFPPELHAIHGIGWQAAWSIGEQSSSYVVLHLHHKGDARWPWSFAATQSFHLAGGALNIRLRADNLAAQAAPLAFGHHPYFDQDGARLSFSAAGVLMNGDDALPTHEIAPAGNFDFSRSSAVAGLDIDHCFTQWNGRARISWADRPLALEITSDLPAAVVYIPEGGSAFCFEPVPHSNNALNRPCAYPASQIIAPGDSFAASISLKSIQAG